MLQFLSLDVLDLSKILISQQFSFSRFSCLYLGMSPSSPSNPVDGHSRWGIIR